MKKTLLIIVAVLSLLAMTSSLPDENIRRNVLVARNTLQTDLYFVYRGDTIDFTNMADSKVVELSDSTVVFVTPTQLKDSILASAGGHDPLTLGDSAIAKGFSLNVQELEFDYSDFLFKSIYDIDNDSIVDNSEKLDGHSISETAYGVTWAGSDSVPTQDAIYDKISSMVGTIYPIILPGGTSSVATRCTGAVEGVDYPTGWVIEADVNTIDLKITHNLGRRVMSVSVQYVEGDVENFLTGTNGYNGFKTTSDNILVIKSFATIPKALVVYIQFV